MSERPGTIGAFSTRVMVALVIVGIFSFSAFITLSTFAPELRRGDNGQAHALSRSAAGFAGAIELMRALGDEVEISRKPPKSPWLNFVILTPTSKVTREELGRLRGYATLIILPKWVTAPTQDHPGWVQRIAPLPESAAIEPLTELAPHAKLVRQKAKQRITIDVNAVPHTSGQIDQLQSLTGGELRPMVQTTTGEIILAQVGSEKDLFILSDPDFLNTQGVADINTAAAGLAIVDSIHTDSPIVFDVTLNGLETARNLLRVMLTPPLVGATLALFAAAALLAWRVVMQSGPRVRAGRAIALGKKALAENSAALIRLAGREHTMGWRYAVLNATTAAEQIGAPRTEASETFAMLDRVGATQGLPQSYSALATEAVNARTPAEVTAAARELYAWTEEMLRAAR